MSNRAVGAYRRGLVPASKVRGVPSKLVGLYGISEEWHHTSAKFNGTDFYNPDKVRAIFGLEESEKWKANPDAINALADWKKEQTAKRKAGKVARYFKNVNFAWRTLEGTGRWKRYAYQKHADMRLKIVGNEWTMYWPDGEVFCHSRCQLVAYRSFEMVKSEFDLSTAREIKQAAWRKWEKSVVAQDEESLADVG